MLDLTYFLHARPAYLELSKLREQFPAVPLLACTATATALVKKSIISTLRLQSPRELCQSFNRPNIQCPPPSPRPATLACYPTDVYCIESDIFCIQPQQQLILQRKYHCSCQSESRLQATCCSRNLLDFISRFNLSLLDAVKYLDSCAQGIATHTTSLTTYRICPSGRYTVRHKESLHRNDDTEEDEAVAVRLAAGPYLQPTNCCLGNVHPCRPLRATCTSNRGPP